MILGAEGTEALDTIETMIGLSKYKYKYIQTNSISPIFRRCYAFTFSILCSKQWLKTKNIR